MKINYITIGSIVIPRYDIGGMELIEIIKLYCELKLVKFHILVVSLLDVPW